MDPISEAVILKCSEWNLDKDKIPLIHRLVLERNSLLKKASDLMKQGKMDV